MIKRRISTPQNASQKLTAPTFFIDNNPSGIVNATPFLDYLEPMKANNPKAFKKQEQVWKLIREGRAIDGLIDQINDQRDGTPYVWLEFSLPRGTFKCRVNILSPQMLDFFIKYQRAEVSTDFFLDQLMEEAEKIENGTIPSTD